MSHNTTITTSLTSLSDIQSALSEMGIVTETGEGLKTHSRFTSSAPSVPADLTFKADNGDTVGFKKQANGTYALVGDFYSGVKINNPDGTKSHLDSVSMSKRVNQMAAMIKVREQLRKKYRISYRDITIRYDKDTRQLKARILVRNQG